MANPPIFQPGFNYTNWQATNPVKPLPAQQVDNDFANAGRSINQAISAIGDVRRSDGKLKNGIVGPDALAPQFSLGFSFEGTWADGVEYQAGDGVVFAQTFYAARASHTSSVANQPPDDDTWTLLFSLDDIVVSGALSMPMASFLSDGVTDEFDLGFFPISNRNLFVTIGGQIQEPTEYTIAGSKLRFVNGAPPTGPLGEAYTITARGFATTGALVVPDALYMEPKNFTGPGTTYTLDVTPGSARNIIVSVGGAPQKPLVDFNVSGTTLTLTEDPGAVSIQTLVIASTANMNTLDGKTSEAFATAAQGVKADASLGRADAGIFPVSYFTGSDTAKIQGALNFAETMGGGIVVVPYKGTDWDITDEILIPSNCKLQGQDQRVVLKGNPALAVNKNLVTNKKNNRLPRTDYDENIEIMDITLDGNWQNRASGGSTDSQGCNAKLSTCKFSGYTRVRSINGVLHCLDICASNYFNDGNINHNAQGPSLHCWMRDCYVENASRDDGITTHNSGYIIISNCRSIFNRALYTVGASQQGIEIDEGCFNVVVSDCYSEGWQKAYQAKGHTSTIPAISVVFERCVANGGAIGFDIVHDAVDVANLPAGQVRYGRNITVRDCKVMNLANTPTYSGNSYPRILDISTMDNVHIDGLEVEGVGQAYISVDASARMPLIEHVYFRDASTRTWDGSTNNIGLIHVFSSVTNTTVTVHDITSEVAQPIPIVQVQSSTVALKCNRITVNGASNTVPMIRKGANDNDEIIGVQGTGWLGHVMLTNVSSTVAFGGEATPSFFEVRAGRRMTMMLSGSGSPEGLTTAPNGTVLTGNGTGRIFSKAGTTATNVGWVEK